jgi:DNA-binding transcriptional MerR regulator
MEERRYGIDELAKRVGVSRRTVRFYVQQGLLPAPYGVGRGKHYGPEHLARLRAVKALQQQGRSLDEVRRELSGGGEAEASALAMAPVSEVPGSTWTRLDVVPGVELHLSGGRQRLSGRALQELEAWCRRHLEAGDDSDVFPRRYRELAEQLRRSERKREDE